MSISSGVRVTADSQWPRWRLALLFGAVWTTVALAFSIHFRFHYLVNWTTALRWGAIDWYIWAALSVPIFFGMRRCLFGQAPWRRLLSVHATAMIAASVLQVALVIAVDRLLGGSGNLGFGAHFQALFAKKLSVNLLAYWSIVGAAQAWFSAVCDSPEQDGEVAPKPNGLAPVPWLERLLVSQSGREFFVEVDRVSFFESAGNYVQLHCEGQTHLIRRTLTSLEEQLNPARFLRLSRSVIVNVEHVREIHSSFNGRHTVLLRNGAELALTRSYRKRLKDRVGDRF